jgi:hypothetical protein
MYQVHCLVADELAAAAHEGWRASDQARQVLLRNTVDLAGVRPGGEFVLSGAGEAYDAQAGEPNRKFRVRRFVS